MSSFPKMTKIVATLGPACDSPEMIKQMLEGGVNVFRFNTKHGTTEWHEERIKRVQAIANKLKKTIGILLDLQGPEIRLETPNKEPFPVILGEVINITPSFISNTRSVCIPHEIVFHSLKKGDKMLIDDGAIELRVVAIKKELIQAEVVDGGTIYNRKGVNLPGVRIELPSLIQDDLKKLDMASDNKVDFVALSFSRTRHDIEVLKRELKKRKMRALVVAKVESMEALENIDELIESADAIMVARGDLGVEVPIEQLAYWQKNIISKCRAASKPVITATQMLQSMTESPRPTRAEATDVANAVLDGTDAVMLSGETASGKYPLRAVLAMSKIASFNEEHRPPMVNNFIPKNQTEIIVRSIENVINQDLVKVKMVLVFTHSGETARCVSKLRLPIPVIAATADQHVSEQLTLSYGVYAITTKYAERDFQLPNPVIEQLARKQVIKKGENILVVHGQHYYEEVATNAVALVTV